MLDQLILAKLKNKMLHLNVTYFGNHLRNDVCCRHNEPNYRLH